MCLAQGHIAVTSARLEPAAVQSQVKHSTTEPPRWTVALGAIFKFSSLVRWLIKNFATHGDNVYLLLAEKKHQKKKNE